MRKNNFRMFWLDGRIGHTTYLMFFLTFVNFIIISFNFLIEGNSFFNQMSTHVWILSIVFIILYVPVSILIGRWHRKTQLSTEMNILIESNSILATMIKTLLDAYTGKASKEKIQEVRKMLLEIEKVDFEKK